MSILNLSIYNLLSHLSRLKLKKTALKSLVFLLTLTLLISGFLYFTRPTRAAWYDDNWTYRTKLTFGNSGSPDANKKVKFDIDTATLITDGKMQADCGDSRFTDISGNLLQYYLDSAGGACNTSSTDYYVLMPAINSGTNIVYHYYGNANAPDGTQAAQFSQATFSPTTGPGSGSEETGPGPVADWKLDEGTGPDALDSSGNNTKLTLGGDIGGGNVTIEQQINIIDQVFTTTSTSPAPTDNSLGLITWDGSKYNGETVYFEAVLGYPLTNPPGLHRRRSTGITLTDGTQYTVRLNYLCYEDLNFYIESTEAYLYTAGGTQVTGSYVSQSVGGGEGTCPKSVTHTPTLSAARLIIVQSGTSVTNTRTDIEIGDNETVSVGTTAVSLNNPKYWLYTQGNYDGTVDASFSATIKRAGGGGYTASACLYTTAGSEVGCVGTTSTSFVRPTPIQVSLTDSTQYEVRVKADASAKTVYIANASVMINQFSGGGITKLDTYQQYNNTLITEATSTYTSKYYDSYYDTGNWNGATYNTYFESTLKTSNAANAYYAQLDTPAGEITATDTSYTRKRSSDISSLLSTAEIDVQIKNASTDTTSSSNSWLIIHVTSISGGIISTLPDWTTENMCYSGKCLYFDGDNDIAYATNSAQIDLDRKLKKGFTFSAWVRANSDGENSVGQIFNKGTSTYLRTTNQGADGYVDLEASLDLSSSDATLSVPNALALNSWHYVAMSYTNDSDDEISLYVDGQLKGTSTNGSGDPASDDNYLLIGGPSSANYHGYIDEIKIYPYERSASEILVNYNGDVGAGIGSPSQDYLTNGLIGYWKMDEASWTKDASGTILDSSGNGNNGTPTCAGSCTISGVTTGKFGKGGDFDGTDDYATVPLSASSVNEFTMSVWFKADVLQYGEMMVWSPSDLSGDNFAAINIRSTPLKLNFYSDWTNHIQYTITAGRWYMATMTLDANNLWKFYVDGQYIGKYQDDATHSNQSTSDYIVFGREYLGYFDGKLDEGRVYNRALSPSEIQALYNWAPGPVGYWKLDENTGITANDSSGFGHTGTLTNAAWQPAKFGSGVYVNGNGHVSVLDDDAFSVTTTGQLTYEGWFKLDSLAATQFPLSKRGSSSNYEWHMRVTTSGTVGCYLTQLDGTTYMSAAPSDVVYASPGQWHHIACVADTVSPAMSVYVDGVFLGSNSTTAGSLGNGTAPVQIGEDGTGGNDMYGVADDVRIYNYTRTPKQIIEDMNAGHPAPGSPIGSAVAQWKFDEGYGDTANNSGSGGSAVNGNLAGSGTTCPTTGSCPAWTNEGKSGKALNYDGSDDYVEVPANPGIDAYEKTEFTVSAWVLANDLGGGGYGRIVDKRSSTTDSSGVGYNLYLMNDEAGHAQLYSAVGCNTQNAQSHSGNYITFGTWHHVAMVFNPYGNNKIYHYIDGVQSPEKGSKTECTGGVAYDSATNLRIGNYAGGTTRAFNGRIDDVRFYNSALTSDQIKTLYNQGFSAVMGAVSQGSAGQATSSASSTYCVPGSSDYCAPPVGEWKFDENTGNKAYDTSGNNLTGTLYGNPTWSADCKSGSCFRTYDNTGTLDVMQTNDNSLLDFSNTQDFTLSMWTKFISKESSSTPILDKGAAGGNNGYNIMVYTADNFSCAYNDGSGTWDVAPAPDDSAADGKWHHLECVMDRDGAQMGAAGIYFYLDGVRVGTNNTLAAGDGSDSTQGLYVGEGGSSGYENSGLYDDVRVYRYARTPSQIAWDFSGGAPIAWYKFDECTGSTIYNSAFKADDKSAATLSGTIVPNSGRSTGTCGSEVSTEMWNGGTTGKFNASLAFDGSGDYAIIPGNTLVAALTETTTTYSRLSWGGWFYPSSSPTSKTLIHKGNEFRLTTDGSGFPQCELYYSGTWTGHLVKSNAALPTSSWSHVLCTYDGAGLKIYVNGLQTGSLAQTNSLASSYSALNIARDPAPSGYFPGQIDDIRLYNYALTPIQVKTIYNAGYGIRF